MNSGFPAVDLTLARRLERAEGAANARLESFFAERGAPTFHEVSAVAPADTLNLLSVRGYTPIEASTVLVIPTTALPPQGFRPVYIRAKWRLGS
jgi:hypothetical protein